jgi:hypothetical protein
MNHPPTSKTAGSSTYPYVNGAGDVHEWHPSKDQEAWDRDLALALHGVQSGLFDRHRGYVIAFYNGEIVGKGKNPLHLRRRIAKKLGIDGLRMILVDPEVGVL